MGAPPQGAKQKQESRTQTTQEEQEQGGTKEKIPFWISRCEERAPRTGEQGLGVSEEQGGGGGAGGSGGGGGGKIIKLHHIIVGGGSPACLCWSENNTIKGSSLDSLLTPRQ